MDTHEFLDGQSDSECAQSETPSMSTSSDGSAEDSLHSYMSDFRHMHDFESLLWSAASVYFRWHRSGMKPGSAAIERTRRTGTIGARMLLEVQQQWEEDNGMDPTEDVFPFRKQHISALWTKIRKADRSQKEFMRSRVEQ